MEIKEYVVCKSDKLIPDVGLSIPYGTDNPSLHASIDERPDAIVLKNRKWSGLQGVLCCNCGYIHLFCVDFKGTLGGKVLSLEDMYKKYTEPNR